MVFGAFYARYSSENYRLDPFPTQRRALQLLEQRLVRARHLCQIERKEVIQTRRVTVFETSNAASLPNSNQIEPEGNTLGFNSSLDDGSNACCFAWYAGDKCTEVSGKSGKLCRDGIAEFDFSVRSRKGYGCNGRWTRPRRRTPYQTLTQPFSVAKRNTHSHSLPLRYYSRS